MTPVGEHTNPRFRRLRTLRRRISRRSGNNSAVIFVDHRFYRKKYDAAKMVQAFSGRLRDETDLDALGNEVVGVVLRTMQPKHDSLWLRPIRRQD
jgi:hypothetical protein